MNIFTNRDSKRFYIFMFCAFLIFVVLSQGYVWFACGAPNLILLLLSLFLAVVLVIGATVYFHRRQRMIDHAITQIDRFVSGDRDARIESDYEGDLFKLFHAVNTLATTLNAYAMQEQNTKKFLKTTMADISHQLKTPLAALAIYNSLLQEECGDKAAVYEFSIKSEKEIERIETLVQNLLKMARLDAGSIVMEMHPEKISDLMNDLKEHFETRTAREQKEIVLSGSPDMELLCDRVWLMEAVSNIVKNALDHTGAGGRIQIEWNQLPSLARIVIEDNGSGIHQSDIHHIFKRFYRSQFSKETIGTGLGLPLAKAITEAHGGNITADSVWGCGSTFTMIF